MENKMEDVESQDLDGIEIHLLTEGVYRRYGYDFRDYSYPSLRRRVQKRMQGEGLTTFSALQE